MQRLPAHRRAPIECGEPEFLIARSGQDREPYQKLRDISIEGSISVQAIFSI
jgi:hypothetical protein